jgi:hypothetical protein
MSRVITEDVLRGIASALEIHAPHLLPTLHKLLRGGLVDLREGTIGSSIHGKLTASISWEDGEPILRALEAIERTQGYNAVFANRQINWLVIRWKKFAEPIQLKIP